MDADTRDIIIQAWAAIKVYDEAGLNEHLAEFDPKAVAQMQAARDGLFDLLTPQVQLCLLPSMTKVAVRTARSNVADPPAYGQVREGAWGPFADRSNRFDRRITTTGGWELMTSMSDNPLTELRVLTDEEWEAIR